MLLVVRVNQLGNFAGSVPIPKNIKDEVIQALRALETMIPEDIQVPHASIPRYAGILEVAVEG